MGVYGVAEQKAPFYVSRYQGSKARLIFTAVWLLTLASSPAVFPKTRHFPHPFPSLVHTGVTNVKNEEHLVGLSRFAFTCVVRTHVSSHVFQNTKLGSPPSTSISYCYPRRAERGDGPHGPEIVKVQFETGSQSKLLHFYINHSNFLIFLCHN